MDLKVLCVTLVLIYTASAAPGSRITGGTPVAIQDFPFVISLVYHYPRPNIYIQRCVGSLISSWHVITTAFCFTGANLVNIHIRAGSANSLSGGQISTLRQVIVHPNYVQAPRSADLAVGVLNVPFGISSTINILYLPPANTYLPEGLQTRIASWGFETEQGPQHQFLRAISLNTVSLAKCNAAFQGVNEVNINDGVICGANHGVGVCFGDSGAPMIYRNVLIGVSSFYKDCGNSAYPDVFTRVDRFTDWIISVAVAPTGETPVRRAISY